jgi:hypothetical protein
MGLTMAERRAVTRTIATRYKRADRAGKGVILHELCAMTGWHRDHARKALRTELQPRVVRTRTPRPPTYGPNVIAALVFCWAVLGMPAGKRLAPILAELVTILRRHGELDIDEDTAALLAGMSAATIDRRLAVERKKHELRGRSHTKPGTLLKSQIPIRTWAQWDDAVPGFVEIDLVGHEGGNAVGEHAYTSTVTDIALGWTENRSIRNKARKWVTDALEDIEKSMPFPLLGIDSDNGSEFINHHLFDWCGKRKLTLTRSRPGNSNDGAHVGQKNWAIVRTVVGYHRYDTEAELLLAQQDLDDLVGDADDGVLGHRRAVDVGEMGADLPGGQPAGVQGKHHLVDIGQPSLPFLDDLRLEGARPVSRDLDLDRPARISEDGLGSGSVAGVATSTPRRGVLVVAEVLGHLLVQGGLDDRLGHRLEQPTRPGQRHAGAPTPGPPRARRPPGRTGTSITASAPFFAAFFDGVTATRVSVIA